MNIGERQTVQRAKHPTLGEGRMVSDNGPAFFVADSGEVEHYRTAFCGRGYLANGKEVVCDTAGYPHAKNHQRIVAEGRGAGWLTWWIDDSRTWCHVFEADDGSPLFNFAVTQSWVGGPKDHGTPPKKRAHLMTAKSRNGALFVYYCEEDAPKAEKPSTTQGELFTGAK